MVVLDPRDSGEQWRQQILEQFDSLFGGRGDRLYGPEHGLAVEETVLDNLRKAGVRLGDADLLVLRSAALLHDVGFARRSTAWSIDGNEHVQHSLEIAGSLLREIAAFYESDLVSRVLELIRSHDNSTYAYPGPQREGMVVETSADGTSSAQNHLLAWLQEADALVHMEDESVSRAVNEWQELGLPFVDSGGFSAVPWTWGLSVVGNLRLTAKRAILDAFSLAGKTASLAAYERAERRLEDWSRRAGIIYEPELCPPSKRTQSLARLAGRRRQIQLLSCLSWQELTSVLREVEIQEDRSILPYLNARVESRVIPSEEVSPLALYAMEDKIARAVELHDLLMAGYCTTILDLPSLLRFRLDGGDAWTIAPPILETFVEHGTEGAQEVTGLVDGLHRWYGARQVGVDQVRCVVIHDVRVPLVPLPVTWEDVTLYPADQPPTSPEEKRRYRYTNRSDFPGGEYGITTTVTEENYQYFFYRDLKTLGSTGVRKFPTR